MTNKEVRNILLTVLLCLPFICKAQQKLPEMMHEPDSSRRKFKDMQNMGDVLNSDKLLMGQDRIFGFVSYNFARIITNEGQNGDDFEAVYRNALGFNVTVRPYKEYKVMANFFYSLNPEARARWTPDFQYAFGKFDWRPNVFNYGYENYSNNFYSDSGEELWRKFLDGYWFISYQHALPNKVMSKIRVDKTSNFMLMYFIRYALQYRNRLEQQMGGIFNGKPVFSVAGRYTVLKNIYIEGAVNQYWNPQLQKMPWDADFTYGFGYYDWRSFRLSLTYGNYSVNRFPWNEKEMKHYGFLDGNFTLMFNYIW